MYKKNKGQREAFLEISSDSLLPEQSKEGFFLKKEESQREAFLEIPSNGLPPAQSKGGVS